MKSSSLPISKDDVRNAAELVKQSGKTPTIQNIRAVLGRGSNTTIVKYQQQLVAEAQEKARLSDPMEPPAEVNLIVTETNDRLTRQIFEAGVKRGLRELTTFHDRILTLEQERDCLIADLDEAVEQLRLSQEEVASVRDSWQFEIREERRRVDSARDELEALRVKSDAAEKSSTERLENLQRDLHEALAVSSRKDVLIAKLKGRLIAAAGRNPSIPQV